MKTIKQTGILVLLLLAGMILTAQEMETSPVTLEKISGSVYQIMGGRGSTGGLIIGENGVLVIDSKMNDESVKQTIEAIGKITDKPIKYLVNTHSDGDHILGNRFFHESVTVIAHENCRDDFFKVNFGRESDWGEPEFYPFTPSVTFKENLNLWLGQYRVELHYFGVGHTTGDIVVYDPKEKIAFLGDQYFTDRPQLIHSMKNGNSFEYVKTITKMLESLDAETFLSGHSEPAGKAEIEKHVQLMVERQKKVKKLVGQDLTMAEVLKEFEDNETRLVSSIFNEITGQ